MFLVFTCISAAQGKSATAFFVSKNALQRQLVSHGSHWKLSCTEKSRACTSYTSTVMTVSPADTVTQTMDFQNDVRNFQIKLQGLIKSFSLGSFPNNWQGSIFLNSEPTSSKCCWETDRYKLNKASAPCRARLSETQFSRCPASLPSFPLPLCSHLTGGKTSRRGYKRAINRRDYWCPFGSVSKKFSWWRRQLIAEILIAEPEDQL